MEGSIGCISYVEDIDSNNDIEQSGVKFIREPSLGFVVDDLRPVGAVKFASAVYADVSSPGSTLGNPAPKFGPTNHPLFFFPRPLCATRPSPATKPPSKEQATLF